MKRHIGRRIGILMGIGAITLLTPGGAVQAQDPGTAGMERPWEVILSLGGPMGGPQDELEAAMAASGFGDTDIAFGTENPFFGGYRWPVWAASLRRRVRPRLDVELIANRAIRGSVHGLHEIVDGRSIDRIYFLILGQSVTTISSIASYRLAGVHVGVGPALNRVRLERGDPFASGSGNMEAWKVGALLDAGITLPRSSRLFFEGRAQYRWIPGTEVGPFTSTHGFEDDAPFTMAAVEVDWSHSFFSVGMGARF